MFPPDSIQFKLLRISKKNKIKEIDARVFIYKPSSLKIHLDRTKFSV